MEARTLIEGRAAAQRLIAGDQTRRRGEAQVIAALCDLAETYGLDEADLLDSLAERRVRVGGEGTPSVSEHLRLEIAGDRTRLEEWLGCRTGVKGDRNFEIEWIAPNGQPGIIAAHFLTADGEVRI